MTNKKSRYDLQFVQSTAGKLSFRRTALKRCTNIEILWHRKLISLASSEFREILLPRSLRKRLTRHLVQKMQGDVTHTKKDDMFGRQRKKQILMQ